MKTLQQWAQQHPQWSLEEFVHIVNDYLPQFLPTQDAITRVQEEVNPRLVRYYATQGLLDKPLKQGREVRYGYRHLLQLLIVRRLLMEGYTATTITRLVSSKSNTDLESLLQGGVQLTVQTANPALAFLEQVQKRSSAPSAPAPATKSLPLENTSPPDSTSWQRLEILPGLEIHIREDFSYPNSHQEQQNLLHIIAHHLLSLETQRRHSL
ncbi:MAG: MerR family transcriptional regulator [Scytolyngbya sp. HA4215-MV1]|jgi:DNA-binding transcriptional MerR regulator|nr:MerR family transcriptional regulator [Scytolyngbya sp. HA4215-MV1]